MLPSTDTTRFAPGDASSDFFRTAGVHVGARFGAVRLHGTRPEERIPVGGVFVALHGWLSGVLETVGGVLESSQGSFFTVVRGARWFAGDGFIFDPACVLLDSVSRLGIIVIVECKQNGPNHAGSQCCNVEGKCRERGGCGGQVEG